MKKWIFFYCIIFAFSYANADPVAYFTIDNQTPARLCTDPQLYPYPVCNQTEIPPFTKVHFSCEFECTKDFYVDQSAEGKFTLIAYVSFNPVEKQIDQLSSAYNEWGFFIKYGCSKNQAIISQK